MFDHACFEYTLYSKQEQLHFVCQSETFPAVYVLEDPVIGEDDCCQCCTMLYDNFSVMSY